MLICIKNVERAAMNASRNTDGTDPRERLMTNTPYGKVNTSPWHARFDLREDAHRDNTVESSMPNKSDRSQEKVLESFRKGADGASRVKSAR
jgi:hypothetical protein